MPLPRLKYITRLSVWLIFALSTPSACTSRSAQRVEGSFILLSLLSNSSVEFDPGCASSFDFTLIQSYTRVNPSDLSNAYDAILWDDLIVNGNNCTGSQYTTTVTYFENLTQSNPSEGGAEQPWFLQGWDNSPLDCPPYRAKYSNQYFFTDDIPGFRDYLVRSQFLPEAGVGGAFRGDIYLFTKGFENIDIESTYPCIYLKEPPNDQTNGEPATPEASSEPNDGGGPVCLSGMTHVILADDSSKPMSSLRLGDKVRRATGGPDDGSTDMVLSFSHRDTSVWTLFLSLTVRIEGAFHNSTIPTNNTNKLIDEVIIELTPGHLVFLYGGAVQRAADLRVGDRLLALGEVRYYSLATVSQIAQVRRRGVYAPVTMSGNIVLEGGIVVSCYTDAVGVTSSHALLAPVRALFAAGLELDWCPFVDMFRKLVFPL